MAPPKPSGADRFKADAEIGLDDLSHVGGGVIYGVSGAISFARSVNPIDPYNLTHPAEFNTNLNNTALGLYNTATRSQGRRPGHGRQLPEGQGRLHRRR